MAQKDMAYDHPSYIVRHQHAFNQGAAGASLALGKFSAFAAMKVFAIHATIVVAGTSTYTAWNGTATATANPGDQLSGIRVSGTTTTTYGPYALNAAAGGFHRIQISQSGAGSNTAGGGVSLAAGDTFHVVRGTDATATIAAGFEWGADPGSSVTL